MHKRLSILIALAAAAMIAVATIIPAMAGQVHPDGTNGQQIEITNTLSSVDYACISGPNQYGNWQPNVCGFLNAPGDGPALIGAGYWWKGQVSIFYYAYPSSTVLATSQCTVPTSYPYDWFNCTGPY